MLRKISRMILAVVCLSLSGSHAVLASPPAEEGPDLQVSPEELEAQTNEEGLVRLGNFGRLHLFGYGELHYNGRRGTGRNEIDFHRLVVGVGYDFADWLQFRSELDFEHAFTEPELEFAYLDFLIRPWLNFRAGSILVPMGHINEHHEPPTFYSVERPELYRLIVPTTWMEGGGGFHGRFENGLSYQLYGLSMPVAAEISGTGASTTIDRSFTGSTGIRGGRTKVGEALARDFGVAGRLVYKGLTGLRLGTSFLLGDTGQGNVTVNGGLLAMVEGDAKYSFQGIDLEGILAFSHLSDAGNVNTALINAATAAGTTFTNFVASQMLGWYLEGAYHLFHHLWSETRHDLIVFGRYEDINTQNRMPAGFAASAANDRKVVTTGLAYRPIPQVALKADYTFNWNRANAGVDQVNLGIGFYY